MLIIMKKLLQLLCSKSLDKPKTLPNIIHCGNKLNLMLIKCKMMKKKKKKNDM